MSTLTIDLCVTKDGVRRYIQCHGVIVFNEMVKAVLSCKGGEETAYGDTYFTIQQLRYKAGDGRYTWLNLVVAVAEERILPNAVEFRVFECVNE